MSTPKHVFIDTCIFDAHQLNLDSPVFGTFLSAVKAQGLTLLLPAPTKLEVERHISQRVVKAHKALLEVRSKEPFIRRWTSEAEGEATAVQDKLKEECIGHWHDFLKQANAVQLDYAGISIPEIMRWYDRGQAPFGTGSKSKEFPDALAFAALRGFAKKNKVPVAVISEDGDFAKACRRGGGLLHFKSIEQFLATLLRGDARLDQVKKLLGAAADRLTGELKDRFRKLPFECRDEPNGKVQNISVRWVKHVSMYVIGVGDNEFDVTFDVDVFFRAEVRVPDRTTAGYSPEHGYRVRRHYRGFLAETANLSGIAKFGVTDSWDALKEMKDLDLENTVVVIEGRPTDVEPDDDDFLYFRDDEGPPGYLDDGPPEDLEPDYEGPPEDFEPDYEGPPEDFEPDYEGPPEDFEPDYEGPPEDDGPPEEGPPEDFEPDFDGPPEDDGPPEEGPPEDSEPDFDGPPEDDGPPEEGPPEDFDDDGND